jgi:hypothetical protein
MGSQEVEQGPLSGFLDPQRFGDSRYYQRRIPDRGQRDKADAVGELSPQILRDL